MRGPINISSYKQMSTFQWVWRYSCFNVTHKKPYKKSEGKTNLLIALNGYVNDLNKLQQFTVSVQKSHHRLNALYNPLGSSTCSSTEVVLAFLLYEGSTIHNVSDQFVSCVYFFFVDFAFHPSPHTKIWSVPTSFKQLYFHTHWKLDTCLYELIYSE